MMFTWLKMFLLCLFVVAMSAVSYAVDGPFTIKNDRLEFPDGSSVATAPRDGKSILNGSGAPGILTAQPGDFYLDTQNSRLYGPYSGSWGAGVSLVGPQGPQGSQGDIGPQGPAGSCTGVVCSGTVPSIMNNMTYSASSVIPTEVTTDLNRILTYYPYTEDGSGNIKGFGNDIGMQFESSGLAIFYVLKYLSTGYIDTTFKPVKVGAGRWSMTTINGASALFVDTSAVRYALPDMYFTALNGNLTRGEIVSGPVNSLGQTALFTNAMVSGKTIKVRLPLGLYTMVFAADGSVTITKPGSSTKIFTWSITTDGRLSVANTITFKIVGGAANLWSVSWTDASYTAPATELGPTTLTIY
ncbi:hypothetical protein FY034_06010 [Trichlorobacter lovleyi]|uniref:hypothetical protein n=1 Tax=Trichlorobacter lovleyi TaxID=313985 RepID=UPI00223ED063|nr:hypothetical protein [Trichlorobacter lovleyi]QOX78500.1 hypothetical protein FY034_06010 [Trichlorobacter lovleyi]